VKRYLTMIDQVVNSLSNILLVVAVARASTAAEFGKFSLLQVVLVFGIGVGRAAVGEPLLVGYSNSSHKELAQMRPSVLGAWLVVALMPAVAVAAVGVGLAGEYVLAGIVLAVALIAAGLHDALRYTAIAEARPSLALQIDGIWLLATLVGVLWLEFGAVDLGLAGPALAWLWGALLSLAVGLLVLKSRVGIAGGVAWLRSHRARAKRYAAEYALLNTSNTFVWFLVSALISSVAVGYLRGTQLLFSPLNTAFNSVRIGVVPDLIRNRVTARYKRVAVEAMVFLVGGSLAWWFAIWLVPDAVGYELLGATWSGARAFVLAFGLQYLGLAYYNWLLAMMRSKSLDRAASWMRGTLAAATLVIPTSFGAVSGAAGVAWGVATAVAACVVVGTVALVRAGKSSAK